MFQAYGLTTFCRWFVGFIFSYLSQISPITQSHAGAVIMHLLCDEVDTLHDWIDAEYGGYQYNVLRQSIIDLRQTKPRVPLCR